MKVAIIGGHVAPALGFLYALPPSVDVIYIGREHVFEGDKGVSLEQQAVQKMGIRFLPLETGRIQRVLTKQTIPSFMRIPKGFFAAKDLLQNERPDVVVGFGGYVSVPVGFAAWLLGIPLIIHESTLKAGLANKILSPFAKKICLSWEGSRKYFPSQKTVVTGDPMLPFDMPIPSTVLPKSKENLPFIVISGGSGGAHTVNVLIENILPQLLEKSTVLHLTGDAKTYNDYNRLCRKKSLLAKHVQERYVVVKYISPEIINSVFAKADLVVGRTGFNTVVTMLYLGKKMICIPLLTGQKNEQEENAKLLENEGLGVILNQDTLTSSVLLEHITKLLFKKAVSSKWSLPFVQNAGEKIYQEVMVCIKKSRNED